MVFIDAINMRSSVLTLFITITIISIVIFIRAHTDVTIRCNDHRLQSKYFTHKLDTHRNFNHQEYSKEAVAHVQKYLMKNEVPVNLFEVGVL